jgi:pimeloyl-ACP methyl ester carboxylesterase
MKRIATLLASLALGIAQAATPAPSVRVVGEGRPVLMIHGLASAAAVWDSTCAALQPGVQCHLVQLPGMAGAAPQKAEAYLEQQREQLQAYLRERGLAQVDVVGHSLGGNLALMLAAAEPQRVARVVAVDSLPFLAALRNPNATPEQARQMAQGLRAGMGSSPLPEAQQRQMAQGLTRSADGVEQLVRWGLASDAGTVVQAMAELWGGDFRPLLPQVRQPLLVLGAWAAYERMGATLASTRAVFERQYAGAPQLTLRMSERGFHFLMWDDADWLQRELRDFLAR